MKRWSSEKLRWNRKLITLGAVALLLMGAIAANFFLGGEKEGAGTVCGRCGGNGDGSGGIRKHGRRELFRYLPQRARPDPRAGDQVS